MVTENETAPRPGGTRVRVLALTVLLAVLAAATWFGWFGWDTTYDIDADGNQTGPYEAWQVVGAVLTMLVLTVLGALRIGTLPTALGGGIGFTLGFVVTASTTDDTGLWLVGAVIMAFGVFLAVYGGAAAVEAIVARRRP